MAPQLEKRGFAIRWLPWMVGLLLAPATLLAQPPVGYYDTVDASNPAALRLTLNAVIDDHTLFPYTSSTTDTWDILNLADEDPNNPNNIIDLYRNASYGKISGGFGPYNREHSWPKSYGFPVNDNQNYPYTDCHQLFAADAAYNSARSNKPFRNCDATCAEWTTDFNDGRGGGSGFYPGNSNWTTGSFTQGTWETWDGRKGDVARALFYMDVRYEGGNHGITGFPEPDLRLTDDLALIDSSRTGANEAVAYMGMLSVLLQWHQMDPPDDRERIRNGVVFAFQGNRNPFIDHPEWVDCLFGTTCGPPDLTPPGAPLGLFSTPSAGAITLDWQANTEPDLVGYRVLRATTAGGPYGLITGSLVVGTQFTDTAVVEGTTYFYVVRAVDGSGNESLDSNETFAAPLPGGGGGGGGTGSVILSEVLYDVPGTDNGLEWVELFNSGDTAVDLSGFSLGAGGTAYTTTVAQLSGIIAPGATFVVGGPTASATNANPVFDLVLNFAPDLQNSGTAADGVALFNVPAAQLTAATVPIDAVLYGPVNSNGLIDETGVANPPEVADVSGGASIERLDLAGSWAAQPAPTPNTTPLGSAPPPPPPPPPGNTAPNVTIVAPANGTVIDQGQSLALAATASDAQDGDLTGQLSWFSDLDGALGTGGAVNALLSAGSHVITASVTDSGGLSALATVAVTVQVVTPPPPPPTADQVTITKAEWAPSKNKLKIKGTVSDSGATLTATFGGQSFPVTNVGGTFKSSFRNVTANPGTVTVTSSGGGSDTRVVILD